VLITSVLHGCANLEMSLAPVSFENGSDHLLLVLGGILARLVTLLLANSISRLLLTLARHGRRMLSAQLLQLLRFSLLALLQVLAIIISQNPQLLLA
jgi:hypothetical protein